MKRPPKSLPQDEFFVNLIIPKHGIHLMGGPSGAGKTTLLLQMLEDWQASMPVLGMKSYPGEWAYVSCDRTLREVWATVDRVWRGNADEKRINAWDELGLPMTPDSLIQAMDRLPCQNGLLFVDGLTMLMGGLDQNKSKDVITFMKMIQRAADRRKMSILGTVANTKLKKGEDFQDLRWNVAGSNMWGHISSTIFILRKSTNRRTPTNRDLHVLPRNAPELSFVLKQDMEDNGRLRIVSDMSSENELNDTIMDQMVGSIKPERVVTTSLLCTMGEERGLSKSSVERWIRDNASESDMDNKRLLRIEKGKFKVLQ